MVIISAVDLIGVFSNDDDKRLKEFIHRHVDGRNMKKVISQMSVAQIADLVRVMDEKIEVPEQNYAPVSYTHLTKVITADNPNEMKTEVRITSASGKTRTVTISFNFERGNKHRIDGAEEEDCFIADRGTSEGRFIANKAVFCYNHNGVMKQQSLHLYSETKPNAGGYSFGSRCV